MKFRTADQQFRYFGMIPAPDIAVHGMNKIFFQLIIHAAPAVESFLLFFRVFPVHIPHQKRPELRPEMEPLRLIIPKHGCVSLQPVKHFPNARVSADDPRHIQIKLLKGRQFQKKPPDTPPEYEEPEGTKPLVDDTPKTGDTKDGMIYIEGFGWVVDNGGGGSGTVADDMYENGNKVGIMD